MAGDPIKRPPRIYPTAIESYRPLTSEEIPSIITIPAGFKCLFYFWLETDSNIAISSVTGLPESAELFYKIIDPNTFSFYRRGGKFYTILCVLVPLTWCSKLYGMDPITGILSFHVKAKKDTDSREYVLKSINETNVTRVRPRDRELWSGTIKLPYTVRSRVSVENKVQTFSDIATHYWERVGGRLVEVNRNFQTTPASLTFSSLLYIPEHLGNASNHSDYREDVPTYYYNYYNSNEPLVVIGSNTVSTPYTSTTTIATKTSNYSTWTEKVAVTNYSSFVIHTVVPYAPAIPGDIAVVGPVADKDEKRTNTETDNATYIACGMASYIPSYNSYLVYTTNTQGYPIGSHYVETPVDTYIYKGIYSYPYPHILCSAFAVRPWLRYPAIRNIPDNISISGDFTRNYTVHTKNMTLSCGVYKTLYQGEKSSSNQATGYNTANYSAEDPQKIKETSYTNYNDDIFIGNVTTYKLSTINQTKTDEWLGTSVIKPGDYLHKYLYESSLDEYCVFDAYNQLSCITAVRDHESYTPPTMYNDVSYVFSRVSQKFNIGVAHLCGYSPYTLYRSDYFSSTAISEERPQTYYVSTLYNYLQSSYALSTSFNKTSCNVYSTSVKDGKTVTVFKSKYTKNSDHYSIITDYYSNANGLHTCFSPAIDVQAIYYIDPATGENKQTYCGTYFYDAGVILNFLELPYPHISGNSLAYALTVCTYIDDCGLSNNDMSLITTGTASYYPNSTYSPITVAYHDMRETLEDPNIRHTQVSMLYPVVNTYSIESSIYPFSSNYYKYESADGVEVSSYTRTSDNKGSSETYWESIHTMQYDPEYWELSGNTIISKEYASFIHGYDTHISDYQDIIDSSSTRAFREDIRKSGSYNGYDLSYISSGTTLYPTYNGRLQYHGFNSDVAPLVGTLNNPYINAINYNKKQINNDIAYSNHIHNSVLAYTYNNDTRPILSISVKTEYSSPYNSSRYASELCTSTAPSGVFDENIIDGYHSLFMICYSSHTNGRPYGRLYFSLAAQFSTHTYYTKHDIPQYNSLSISEMSTTIQKYEDKLIYSKATQEFIIAGSPYYYTSVHYATSINNELNMSVIFYASELSDAVEGYTPTVYIVDTSINRTRYNDLCSTVTSYGYTTAGGNTTSTHSASNIYMGTTTFYEHTTISYKPPIPIGKNPITITESIADPVDASTVYRTPMFTVHAVVDDYEAYTLAKKAETACWSLPEGVTILNSYALSSAVEDIKGSLLAYYSALYTSVSTEIRSKYNYIEDNDENDLRASMTAHDSQLTSFIAANIPEFNVMLPENTKEYKWYTYCAEDPS